MSARWVFSLVVAGALLGCGAGGGPDAATDTGPGDSGSDGVDASTDGPADVPVMDAVDAGDARSEGGTDASEGGMDGGPDVVDAGAEGGADTRPDAGPRTTRIVNQCDPATATDLTVATNVVIVSGADGEFRFDPPCIRIRVGQRVTFRIEMRTTWMSHPLQAGEIDPVTYAETVDPTSPIPYADMGTADIPVTFTTPGSYPYYCTRHFLIGHLGAIHVVP